MGIAGGTPILLSSAQVVAYPVTPSQRSDHSATRVFGWRALLVLAAVCSLMFIVATRYSGKSGATVGAGHSVKVVEPKGQRLIPAENGPRLPRFEPVATLSPCTFEPRIVADAVPIRTADTGDAISDRAPPLFS